MNERELEAEAAKEAAAKRERDKRIAEIQNEARQAFGHAAQRKDRDILRCLADARAGLAFCRRLTTAAAQQFYNESESTKNYIDSQTSRQ